VLALFIGWVAVLWPSYHVFGTDQTGNDVLYQAIKSVRTAVVIGSLATLATLPFAIVFGILAGYYKGAVDDAIQYLYTVLSSIPSVLLIAAFVLMIQVYIDKNPQMFETGLERADIRLFLLARSWGSPAGRGSRGSCAPRR
jgi:peptide/nickel transport system permease protein